MLPVPDADNSDFIRGYPRPLAWAFSEVAFARDPIARFLKLQEMTEEIIRYLALIALARYVEIREPVNPAVEESLWHLRRPTLGHWACCLERLDRHLCAVDAPPFGRSLDEPCASEAMGHFVKSVRRASRGKVSPMQLFRALVALRNRTKGHGTIRPEFARAESQPLMNSLLDLLRHLPGLAARPPVSIRSIDYKGHNRFAVEYLPVTGTGRTRPQYREVSEPGVLEPGHLYLWDGQGGPLRLTPFMHLGSQQAVQPLYLLSAIPEGIPEYSSCQTTDEKHRPDHLMSVFKERAPFLLEQRQTASTGPRPTAAADAYQRTVEQALSDGIVTQDEWDLLAVLRKSLGLSNAEAKAIHDISGMPANPASSPPPAVELAPEPQPTGDATSVASPNPHAIARELDLSDDLDGAIEAYKTIINKEPSDETARAALAALLLETSQHEDAEEVCKEGLRLADSGCLRAALASVLVETGRLDEAFEQANRAVAYDPPCIEACLAMAECCSLGGDVDEQRRYLDMGAQVDPTDPRLIAFRASAASELGEDPFEALRTFRHLLRVASRDRTVRLHYAISLKAADEPVAALIEIRRLTRRNTRSASAMALLAVCAAMTRNLDEANQALECALDLCGDSIVALVARGLIYIVVGQYDRACIEFSAMRVRYPRYALAAQLSAHGYRSVSDLASAEQILRDYLRTAPNSSAVRLDLVKVLSERDEHQEALEEAQVVLSAYPDLQAAKRAQASALIGFDRLDEAEKLLHGLRPTQENEIVRARVFMARQSHGEAEVLLRTLLRRDPYCNEAGELMLHCLGVQGRGREVEMFFRNNSQELGLRRASFALAMIRSMDMDVGRKVLIEIGEPDGDDLDLALRAATEAGFQELRFKFANLAVERRPESADAHFEIGWYYHDQGEYELAAKSYADALAREPGHELAANNLGVILSMHGRTEEAVEYLGRVSMLAESPAMQVRARLNLARAFAQSDKQKEAEAEFDTILEIDASCAVYQEISEICRDAGVMESAVRYADAGQSKHPNDMRLRLLQASLATMRGDHEEALLILRNTQREVGYDSALLVQLGQSLEDLGRRRQAAASYRRACDLAPDDFDVAVAYGECLLRLGEYDKAREVFEHWLDDDDCRDVALEAWVGEFLLIERCEEGLSLVRDLLTTRPDNPVLHAWEGVFLKELGDHAAALPLLESAAEAEPTYRLHLAECFAALGRPQDAISTLGDLLEDMPGLGGARRSIIRILAEQGHRAWASDHVDKLLEFEPDATDVEELRALVAQTSDTRQ